MREFRLNRKQKIVRNLLMCGLLWLAVYAMLGFPPYTVRGMLDRVERRYLLSDLEPLLVERSSRKYSNQFYKDHDTYLLAKSGDTYLHTMYTRSLLRVRPEYGRYLKMGHGALCTARDGTMYVAGPFRTAVSATAEVTAQKTTQYYTQSTDTWETVLGESCTFTFQGERLGEGSCSPSATGRRTTMPPGRWMACRSQNTTWKMRRRSGTAPIGWTRRKLEADAAYSTRTCRCM